MAFPLQSSFDINHGSAKQYHRSLNFEAWRPLMRLAKHKSEGDKEELFAEIVVDVQNPAAPIFGAARCSEGSYDLGRVITRLSKIVYHGAAAID
jgi:hypothetical protein